MDVIKEIEKVLEMEIEALQRVRSNLNDPYTDCVQMIQACEGQVIVTGLGKSGIIAQKIAATLRSTGTPSVFLHPSEALHGDVAVVSDGDVVLAIGKSGETKELNELLRFVRKSGIRVIAITSDASSQMASLSDIVLDLKVQDEACPLNLTPTCSTTATLAVGDAIAVALMKLKNVSEDDFARTHPSGQLGRRLLLHVEDIMKRGGELPVVRLEESVRQMLYRITQFRVGAIAVVDEANCLVGLVTDYDVRHALETHNEFFSLGIGDIMNADPETILVGTKAVAALDWMRSREKPIAVAPVIDDAKKVIGILHLHDLIAAGL